MTQQRDELAQLVESADAGDQQALVETAVTEPMIAFRLASRWFAVHADHVREVIAGFKVSRVPGVPGHILGVALVHSRLVPVIDLSDLVGIGGGRRVGHDRLVVVGTEQAEVSIVAEEARGVVDVAAPSDESLATSSPFVRGEVRWGNRLVCVLDGEALVTAATEEAAW